MRNLIGYLLGLCLFVLGIPALMWLVSERGFPYAPESFSRIIWAVLLVAAGLALSIWSIVHMRRVGKGNPFDAYGHELAPRTRNLMTDGPYSICRNPMLLGVYILDAGVMLYLWAFLPLLVFAVEVFFLNRQVRSEEKRLTEDFGEAYLAYSKSTNRYIPSLSSAARGGGWLGPRLRLFSIYLELGYNPWRKSRKARAKKEKGGVYMGTRDAIPFLNEDAKRTFTHLIFRPGYLIRDYVLRGQHERYLAPFTALLVFYSVMTLLLAVVQPKSARDTIWDEILTGIENSRAIVDSTAGIESRQFVEGLLQTTADAILLTRLDLYPEAVNTPWKESIAALEADIRSKGIPMFLGTFLLLWLSMALLLRKYKISFSGAAAASAYVLCQFCVFMFLALLLSFGGSAKLGEFLMGLLLYIDYRQWLGIGKRKTFRLTLKTGFLILVILLLFYLLVAAALLLFVYYRV